MASPTPPSARTRLVIAASDLFYQRGIPNVGVYDVTDRAGVARQSLYNNFDSKNALVLAVLQERAESRRDWLATSTRRADEPASQLLAVFDLLGEWLAAPDFRGCAFINATVELAGTDKRVTEVVRDHKNAMRAFLEELARSAGLAHPADLSGQLMLLIDGATVTALVQGEPSAAEAAKEAAAVLIDAARVV